MENAVTNSPSTRASIHNPFPGLRPIGLPLSEHEDSPIVVFNEQDRHLKNLMLKLGAYRFITLVGGANVGKTTIAYTGLLPILRGGFEVNGKSNWKIATLIPRQNPMDELAHALMREDLQIKDLLKSDMLNILNKSGSAGIIKAYEALMSNRENDRDNLLIFIDQFDEFFQYYNRQKEELKNNQHGNAKISKIELNILKAQRFIGQLLEACKQTEYPIYVLATMRSTSLAETGQFPGLPDLINQGQYVLPAPKEREIKKGIIGPIDSLDFNCEDDFANNFWEQYLQGKEIPLPLIQLTLMRAWNEKWTTDFLSMSDIDRIFEGEDKSKIEEILNDVADNIFESLGREEATRGIGGETFGYRARKTLFEQELNYNPRQLVCRTIFRHLLQNANTRDGLVAVPFNSLLTLISNPDLSHLEPIHDAITDYKQLLMQNLATGDKYREEELEKMPEDADDPVWFTEEWKKDDIGRMVYEYSLEGGDKHFQTNDIESAVEEVIASFRKASLLKVYGEIDLADTSKNSTQILHNSHVQISNDVMLDNQYGWKQLKEWQAYYDTTTETYRQLYMATKNWKEATANGKKEEDYLWSMPELGLAIKWIYHFKPSVEWLTRMDNQFQENLGGSVVDRNNQGEGEIVVMYRHTFDFLVKSIQFYQRETIDKDQAQKEELKKTKRRLLISKILGGLAFLGAFLAVFFMIQAWRAQSEADESRNEAIASRDDASSFAKQALLNEYEAKRARVEADSAKEEAILDREEAEEAKKEEEKARKKVATLYEKAEEERKKAEIAKNDALKKQLLAKAAQIEAEAARILALLAEKESERLRNVEYIRRKSLDLIAMVDDGQIEAARKEIQALYKDPLLKPLADENREFYMALQKLFFNTDSLRERYSYSIPEAGGIRTLTPHPTTKDAFIVGGANGRIAYLKAVDEDNDGGLAKYSFSPVASGDHVRSLAMDNGASRLLVGTSEGALIGINWGKDTMNWQPEVTSKVISKKKPLQLKRLYREKLDDTTIVRGLEFVEKGPKLLLQYYRMTNKSALGNLQTSRLEDKLLMLPFPMKREFNYKKAEKAGTTLTLPSYTEDSLRIDAMAVSSNHLFIAGRITKKVKDPTNLIYSSRVYIYDLDDPNKAIGHVQIPPPSSADKQLVLMPFITALGISPDGNYLAIGKYNGEIYLFKNPLSSSKDSVFIPNAHYSQISAFDFFQKDGMLNLAVASYDHTGSLIDVYDRFKKIDGESEDEKKFKDMLLMKIHQRWMYKLKYTNSGKQILTISEDGTAKLWFTTVQDTYKRIFGNAEST